MDSPTAIGTSLITLQTDVGPFSFGPGLESQLLRAAAFLVGLLVVVVVGWFVVEPAIARVVRSRNRNNPTLDEAITRYIRLAVLGTGLFVGIRLAGFSGSVGNSALVIAGVTVALGIAGQSVIGSLVSGTALVVDPEFNVGNYIRWDGGEGEVTSITLRVTRVRTPDGGLVTIPNTTLTDDAITRPFERGRCRTTQRVSVAYEADVETALYVLSTVTAGIDGVLDTPEPRIGVEELGDDGVILRVEYWVEDPVRNLFPTQSAFSRAVLERFDGAGIEISPSPKRDLEGHVRVDEGR